MKTPKLVNSLKSVGKQIALKNVKPEKLPRENTAYVNRFNIPTQGWRVQSL